jgi:hypothetical protein
MVTPREVLEYLAAEGCVRGATEVITQAVLPLGMIEEIERHGAEFLQRDASKNWRPMLESIAQLLQCDVEGTLSFIASFSQPSAQTRLENAFIHAHLELSGLNLAILGKSPDPARIIALAVQKFSEPH